MTPSLNSLGLEPAQMIHRLDDFMARITDLTKQVGLELSSAQADHVALRVNSLQIAELAHQSWMGFGNVISTAQINGRPIVVIQFYESLEVGNWRIECLELPYPAPGKTYPKQDWEHVEFVVESQADTAEGYLEDLRSRFPEFNDNWDKLNEKGIKTKLSSPKGEGERLANPTIAFKYQGICFKIHPHSLRKIVASEQWV